MKRSKPRKPKKDGGKVSGSKAKFRMDRSHRRADGGSVSGDDVAAAQARNAQRPTRISDPADIED